MAALWGGFFAEPPPVPVAEAERALHERGKIRRSDFLQIDVQCSLRNDSVPHCGGHPHDDMAGERVPRLSAKPNLRSKLGLGDAVEEAPILIL